MYLCRAFERPSKPLKGSKLRRTSNLTFLKTGLKLLTEKQWLRLSLATIEYATNTYEKYFYTFRINQLNLPLVKEKRNGLTFTVCSVKIFRFLLLSPPYWKWSYHNATQSECAHWIAYSEIRQKEVISGRFPITKSELPRCCARDKALFCIFDPHDSVETNIYLVFAHDFVLALRFWIFFSLLTYITDSTKFLRCFLFTDGRSQLQHSDTSTNSVKRRMLKH